MSIREHSKKDEQACDDHHDDKPPNSQEDMSSFQMLYLGLYTRKPNYERFRKHPSNHFEPGHRAARLWFTLESLWVL